MLFYTSLLQSMNDWLIYWMICIWVRGLSASFHLSLDYNEHFVPHIETWEPRKLTKVPDGTQA